MQELNTVPVPPLPTQDIRQMLNLLQIWRPAAGAPGAGMSAGDVTKNMQSAFKDVDVGPFDVADKFFREPNADFDRRLRHYFVDTSMTPLLVYENYLSVSPPPPPGLPPAQLQAWLLHRATLASDFIACSDVVGARILKEQQWGLAPLHGALSCLAPGYMMQGNLGRLQFPQWLGRNSTGNSKRQRTLRALGACKLCSPRRRSPSPQVRSANGSFASSQATCRRTSRARRKRWAECSCVPLIAVDCL